MKVYEAIVKGDNIPEPGVPESFKVLMKEMQALCINVEVLADGGSEMEMRELDEDVFRAAEELGIDISAPNEGRRRGRSPAGPCGPLDDGLARCAPRPPARLAARRADLKIQARCGTGRRGHDH